MSLLSASGLHTPPCVWACAAGASGSPTAPNFAVLINFAVTQLLTDLIYTLPIKYLRVTAKAFSACSSLLDARNAVHFPGTAGFMVVLHNTIMIGVFVLSFYFPMQALSLAAWGVTRK